jgi:tripartite-type tricarboxylate transporter receptor subunit TctC
MSVMKYKNTKRSLLVPIVVAMCGFVPALGMAEEAFPSKPINFVIGWSAGGGSDLSTRFLLSHAEKHLGQPFAVQNMEGGSGAKAYMYIAKSKADGYTLGNTTSTISTHRFMGTIPLGSQDFEPIIAYNEDPGGLWVKADAPWKTLQEFIDYSKAHAGEVTVAASNPGSITRFQMMAIENATGLSFNVLSQKGGAGPGLVALAGGHIPAAMGTPLEGFTLYKAGKIRPLGFMSEERVTRFSDVPTFKEQGVPVVLATNRMIVAPKGTPKDRIQVLYEALKKGVHTPEFQESLESKGSSWLDWDPEKCRAYLKEQDAKFEALIKKAGLYNPAK